MAAFDKYKATCNICEGLVMITPSGAIIRSRACKDAHEVTRDIATMKECETGRVRYDGMKH